MAYVKLNLKNGTKLTENHLAHIEDGIYNSLPADYKPPVTSVNGMTGDVIVTAEGGAVVGPAGEDGGYYTPSVSTEGVLSWAASKSGMPAVSSANIKGPKGDTGETGEQGPKGDTGETGPGGAAGYTPVKGTDYWTAADKQSMVSDVLAEMPVFSYDAETQTLTITT